MTSLANQLGNGLGRVIDRASAIPLYYQLARHLEGEIRDGAFRSDKKFLTDMELSMRYNVSRPTVRQAMSELVNKGLLVRERGRGTFVRPASAMPKVNSRVIKYRRVGLVMPWGPGTFFAPMLESIEDAAHNTGFHIVLANNREDSEIEIDRVRELLDHGVDGVLWMCPSRGSNQAMARRLLQSVPVVVGIDRIPAFPDIEVNLVEGDHYGGIKQSAGHLIEQSRKKIALVHESLPLNATYDAKRGYRDALREGGIEFNDDWVFTSRQLFRENGRLCARKILQSDIDFDAICCCTDSTAIGVIHELRERDVKIPSQIAVTGFNDDPIATAVRPQLTTVHQDIASIGRRAAELLLEQLEQLERGEVVAPTKITVPVKLVIRECTSENEK